MKTNEANNQNRNRIIGMGRVISWEGEGREGEKMGEMVQGSSSKLVGTK